MGGGTIVASGDFQPTPPTEEDLNSIVFENDDPQVPVITMTSERQRKAERERQSRLRNEVAKVKGGQEEKKVPESGEEEKCGKGNVTVKWEGGSLDSISGGEAERGISGRKRMEILEQTCQLKASIKKALLTDHFSKSSFVPTLQHMQYRAYCRGFFGSHVRSWSALAAAGLFLVASVLNLTIYSATCQTHMFAPYEQQVVRNVPQRGLLTYAIAVLIIFVVICFLFRTYSSNRYMVYAASSFAAFDMCTIIVMVVISAAPSSSPTIDSAAHRIKRSIVSDFEDLDDRRALQNQTPPFSIGLTTSGITLLGQDCGIVYWNFLIWHWLLVSLPIFALLVALIEFAWLQIWSRLANWYHNKSKYFPSRWIITEARHTYIYVPVFNKDDTGPRLRDLTADDDRVRFEILEGIHIECCRLRFYFRLLRKLTRKGHNMSTFTTGASSAWRVSYTGQCDDLGRPDGFGFWKGCELEGENMVGYWSQGLPSSPMRSQERLTGSGLVSIKLGWSRCNLMEKKMEFGYASVECSVSGRFYRGFPKVQSTDAPSMKSRVSGRLAYAGRKIAQMVKDTRRVVTGTRSVTELQSVKPPMNSPLVLSRSDEAISAIQVNGGDEKTDPFTLVVPQRAQSVGTKPSKSHWWHRTTTDTESMQQLREECALRVRHLYKLSIRWVLQQLHPHNPSFGLQPRSELTITIDRDKGLNILGYVPLCRIVKDSKNGHESLTSMENSSIIETPSIPDIITGLTVRPAAGTVTIRDPNLEKLHGEITGETRSPVVPLVTTTTAPEPIPLDTGSKDLPSPSVDGVEEPIPTSVYARSVSVLNESALPVPAAACPRTVEVTVVEQALIQSQDEGKAVTLMPELQAKGWIPMDSIGLSEVLIYIHGFNNSQKECQQTLGQMMAFGNFPTHLKVIVFVWPAGHGVLSYFVARRNSEDPLSHQALIHLLVALRESGIKQVHILAHSMGCRLFLKALRTIISEDIFAAHADAGDKLELLTTTFMNPEYFLDEFIAEDYNTLRSCCPHITVYADANDQALFYSELFSRRRSLGRAVFGFRKENLGSPENSSFTYTAPKMINTSSFVAVDRPSAGDISKVITTAKREELESTKLSRCCCLAPKNAHLVTGDWMDLDVIDTTFMDRNVESRRHSFWNLNREIIEDLRELLVSRKRARYRNGRLDRRVGNVWVFRVAPSFLTSIFDN